MEKVIIQNESSMTTINGIAWNGGGSKGLQALFLGDYIYKNLGIKFLQLIDIHAGTSTGALIAALLSLGFTPREIIDIYVKELPGIFDKRFMGQLRGLSKYDNEYLKSVIKQYVGNKRLGDLEHKLIIPTVNTSLSRQKIFKSHDPKDANVLLSDVLLATAAAPTYFPAHYFGGNWYKDGGLAENNPSEIVRKEAVSLKADEVNILNITTGRVPQRASKAEQKGGLLSVPAMLDEMLDIQDQITKGHVEYAYKTTTKGLFVRAESVIHKSSGAIDDVSKKNIQAMIEDGQLAVEMNKKNLDLFLLKIKNENQ